MIVDALVQLFLGLIELLLGLLPALSMPAWLDAAGPALALVFERAGALGAWLPLQLAFAVLTGLLTLWGLAFGTKFVRMIASFLTGGGGSAA